MKRIEIVGRNYFGQWEKTRCACRGIIRKDNEILLSYESNRDTWMIPGGGLEDNETEQECCIREVAEETGYLVNVSDCLLEINEYYEEWKWVNHYFLGEVVGTTEQKLTKRENEVGLEPRWVPIDEIIAVFSKHNTCADADEMIRGRYLREFTALSELLK